MTINTNISNPELTKFAKYMFFIEMGMYFPLTIQEAFQKLEPGLDETFKPLNVYIQDDNRKDYSILEQLESDNPSFIYHITCATNNPRFRAQLAIIQTYPNFVDCYQYENSTSNTAVIRCRLFVKSRMKKLVESKYSEMYAPQEYNSILNNASIAAIYAKFNYETKENEFNRAFHVLLRTDKFFNEMVDQLGLTDSKTIEALRTNEFDSKYSIEKETLRFSNQYNMN